MHPPGTETESLRDLQKEDLEKGVDYESATVFVGLNGYLLTTITGEDDTSCAPSPFVVEWKSQNICFVSNSPLAPGRQTNEGGTPIPCAKPSSPCVPVGWAGCTLLGGLGSMLIRIVFGTDGVAVVWKFSHDRPGTWCDRSNRSQLSNKAKLESSDHLSRTFWPLDPSCTCLALPLRIMSASNRRWVVLENCLHPGQIITGCYHLILKRRSPWRRVAKECSPGEVDTCLWKKIELFNANQSNPLTYDYDYVPGWACHMIAKSPFVVLRGPQQDPKDCQLQIPLCGSLKKWIAVRSRKAIRPRSGSRCDPNLWFVELSHFGHNRKCAIHIHEKKIFLSTSPQRWRVLITRRIAWLLQILLGAQRVPCNES